MVVVRRKADIVCGLAQAIGDTVSEYSDVKRAVARGETRFRYAERTSRLWLCYEGCRVNCTEM